MAEHDTRTTTKTPALRRLLVGAGVLAAVSLLLLVSSAYFATADPSGCARCHDDATFAEATASSSHGDVTCGSCHTSATAIDRIRLGTHATLRTVGLSLDGDTRTLAAVDDSACRTCHDQDIGPVVEANGIRIDHVTCTVDTACTECHASTAHGGEISWRRDYNMDACLRCHAQQRAELVPCDTCHIEKAQRERIATGPWSVTHGPNWQVTHGMGDAYTCAACHAQGYCDRCHGVGLPHDANLRLDHARLSQHPDAQCTSCHSTSFCDSCHGTPMPHETAFVMGHGRIVEEDGEALCKTCHAENDCVTCHISHVHPGGVIDSAPLKDPGGAR